MKVLVADKFPEKYLLQMKELGLEVNYSPQLVENNLHEAIADTDILVVRSTKVNAASIEKANLLNLIIRAGAGVNNIDIAAANKKGIYVANCPGMNSIAVAELAMGLMLSLDRRIPDNVMDFKNSVWNKGEYSKAEGLFGKNLALIGVGNIGKEVAKRALAFGMNVYGKDISRIEGVAIKDFSEMDKILPMCDIISIHLPLTPQTRGLFNKEMFGYLHPNTLLINTSRAEIIDEDAMLEAIKEKKIHVALDVFKGEPEQKSGAVTSPLQQSKNIYVTHHIGASTEQAQNAVAAETVRIIKDYLNSGLIAHWVNKATSNVASYQLVVKHFDKPGVLSSIFSVIKEEDVNIEEIENIIFEGGLIASCTMKLKAGISTARLQKIQENPNVLSVSYIAL
ncbi:MAG: phosphoglycerate dehydrogenase [Ignavibacteria bacterium CG_4_8_14_3_um_filter_37_9]|nr:phosphoglycerate dehydrogenase [Ignavibacteria bacterium]OIO21894.1 MAG: phosphoglycerate dehydrogenase [Ignavibacteria bacterium CG1_02_37_35]PIP76592.1 MAG: phosphoglycerate dehydrogenase [Ignavibacteria bacterium CG22_combo_CG10-13_8_21_14_all_37_15]PIS44461.1 MAG: phosphoglycerate dehydrogenase [Ignavibacteria bacterium CG08_land_8_20_14_0_20_37_9]PIW98809.1 MAG: phosphoglycerate dehydrogenase [Ignavibacteria bacterium CG_4_8_14_3_um_filter_37_9]PIX92871.1 MAG: phosphoglycerate dehydrog